MFSQKHCASVLEESLSFKAILGTWVIKHSLFKRSPKISQHCSNTQTCFPKTSLFLTLLSVSVRNKYRLQEWAEKWRDRSCCFIAASLVFWLFFSGFGWGDCTWFENVSVSCKHLMWTELRALVFAVWYSDGKLCKHLIQSFPPAQGQNFSFQPRLIYLGWRVSTKSVFETMI